MCRWIAYSGDAVYLEQLIFEPEHSLIDQSLEADFSETTTNGDGFGIGWYGTRDIPGLYRNVRPAWNDDNLRSLSRQIESRMFLAHVRAATGATAVQDTNCHPFRFGKWLFVHNGLIEGFKEIKRDLVLGVAPKLYPYIEGNTDSEVMFYLALTFDLEGDPLSAVARMVGFIEKEASRRGIDNPVQMTLGISDGASVWAFRYSSEHRSRSLYISKSITALKEINPALERFSDDARAVVSEPLTDLTDYWHEIPESTVLKVWHGRVDDHRFVPQSAA